jgi:CheY-like chemotaxis protein
MPDMDGYEFVEIIRVIQILSLFPPIFVTAISNEQKIFYESL